MARAILALAVAVTGADGTVAVTGATGKLGRHAVEQLVAAGDGSMVVRKESSSFLLLAMHFLLLAMHLLLVAMHLLLWMGIVRRNIYRLVGFWDVFLGACCAMQFLHPFLDHSISPLNPFVRPSSALPGALPGWCRWSAR